MAGQPVVAARLVTTRRQFAGKKLPDLGPQLGVGLQNRRRRESEGARAHQSGV